MAIPAAVMLAPPAMAPMGVVIIKVMVRVPVTVGIVPGVRRGDIGQTDDCDGSQRERERSQEVRARSRIARGSRRHGVSPFPKGSYGEQDNARAAPAFP